MSNGHLMDIHWTGGLDQTVGQAWSWSEGEMCNACPMDVRWRGGLDKTVEQA